MVFGLIHQLHFSFTAEAEMIIFRCSSYLCHTFSTEMKMEISQQLQELFRFYHTCHTYFLQGFVRNDLCLMLVQAHHPPGLSCDTN